MRPRRRASARCATSSIWPARRSRSWRGGSRSCASRRRSASRPSSTPRRSTRWRRKLDELRRARDQTQARIAFLEGPPDTGAPAPASAPAPDDTAGVQDRAKNLERIARELEGTLFSITHEGSERIIAEHERRVAEIEALRAKDGSNAAAGRPADRAVGGGARCAALAAAGQGGRGRREGPCRQRARGREPRGGARRR